MKLIGILFVLISLINISQQKLYIRKNINSLTAYELSAYRKCLTIMKSRDLPSNTTDPTGFMYQSNIHAWSGFDGSPASVQTANRYNWQQCTHRSDFFLVWHRMYLWFFERICRKASGNPNFALPYWDWKNDRKIPDPYRTPANDSNPFYVSQRCANLNRGASLPAATTNPNPALESRFFSETNTNTDLDLCFCLGGGRITRPAFIANREGLLEGRPHDILHVSIGGPVGYMTTLCTAAIDPIFYLHHAMVDRVWASWINLGGTNEVSQDYRNTSFRFFDENGRIGTYYIRDFLNNTNIMNTGDGYKYDSLIADNKVIKPPDQTPDLKISVDETEDLYINATHRTINLRIKPQYYPLYDRIAKKEQNMSKVRFTLQTQLSGIASDLIFRIYLNLPPDTDPQESLMNMIGSIALFQGRCLPSKLKQNFGINDCYDITEPLFKSIQTNYMNTNILPSQYKNLTLTIVPKSCDIVTYPLTERYLIAFFRTLVVHYFIYSKKVPDHNYYNSTIDNNF